MNNSNPLRIGVVGAGATGLAAAWDLVNAGHNVTLFEAEERVGGLAAGFKDPEWDWWLEKFYHHWFEGDKEIMKLADEMGARDQIIFPRPKTSYWIDGELVRSEISPSVLLLPLSPLAKLRFLMAGAIMKFTPDWRSLEKVTAHEWFLRWMGEEGYNKFFRPLLIGKFGVDYKEVNMAWMWARVQARSLRLGIFQGGFQAFLDLLGEMVTERGATINLNTRVDGIELDGLKPTLVINGEQQYYDYILSTTSPKLLLKMSPRLADTAYGDRVNQLYSIGALCVVLALKHSLLTDGTYWLNLPATSAVKRETKFPFLALVEHTNWMDRSHYNGDHLIYCGDYVAPTHEYFRLSEDELVERFVAVLPEFNPDFKPDWIRKSWVFRAPYAQPVPGVNHAEKIPPIETPLPGVYWASMSQVYPWDRGTNYAVELGRRVANSIMENAAR